MRFDLDMVCERCSEVGLACVRRAPEEVAVQLEPDVTLLFQNAPDEDDNLIGFEGTPWHSHDGLMCVDSHGIYVELNYLDLVSGLADGTVLICESWVRGAIEDRWLVPRDFVDECRHMKDGEEIRIRPVGSRNREDSTENRGA
tara:strand:- start:663 stop:1091 length:429 start_codon:yes stop_codon:yes gene_type:complete